MRTHGHDLGNDGFTSPLDAKDLGQLLEVVRCGLPDRKDRVTQPAHAQSTELLVEEFDTQLTCQERDILDDSKSDSPLLVLGKLCDGGEKRLGEEINSNDCVKSALWSTVCTL